MQREIFSGVYETYEENLDDVDFEKKYHFARNLYLWSQDESAKTEIFKMRPTFVGDDRANTDRLQEVFLAATELPVSNSAELRIPLLKKYPLLRPTSLMLLDALYTNSLFGEDKRQQVLDIVDEQAILKTKQRLLSSPRDVAVLSTYAVNFLYLVDGYLFEENKLDPQVLSNMADSELDINSSSEGTLWLYFMTHCIINETQFYSRRLPDEHSDVYVDMLKKVDQRIHLNYDDIKLDIKFESLVCGKICGYKLGVEEQILMEAELSIAPEGYIVDTHNNTVKPAGNNTLSNAEHRNVLFLMSQTEFNPPQKQ